LPEPEMPVTMISSLLGAFGASLVACRVVVARGEGLEDAMGNILHRRAAFALCISGQARNGWFC